MTTARNKCIVQRYLFLFSGSIDFVIKKKKGRKTDKEVNTIKCRSYCISHIAIFKRVVRIRRNRQCFHKSSKVRKAQYDCHVKHTTKNPRSIRRYHFSQHGIGKCMVGCEIEMGCKIKSNRYIVQTMSRHGVFGLENRIKIWDRISQGREFKLLNIFRIERENHSSTKLTMSIPVISNKRIYSNP